MGVAFRIALYSRWEPERSASNGSMQFNDDPRWAHPWLVPGRWVLDLELGALIYLLLFFPLASPAG